MTTVGCILVLYNPDWKLTEKVINNLLPQVDSIYLIDNSPSDNRNNFIETAKIKYYYLGGNKGIAYAQNIGLNLLRQDNLNFCFFLDQDSIVENDMVNILIQHYNDLISKGFPVGAIGPRPINRQQNKAYRGSIKKGISIDKYTTEVTELISSASLIPTKLFDKVGTMDTDLFIDGVDHEWCWRCAKRANARFYISEKTHLSHQLGEGDRKFIFKTIAIPTPFRTYYQFRNYFILVKRDYVPLYWKLSNGIKYLIKSIYYPLFIAPRLEYLKNISKGIYEGFQHLFR